MAAEGLPIQTFWLSVPAAVVKVIVESALTVTEEVVLVQPLASVNVKVTEPGAAPVTTPAFVTVAIELLLLVHVPPVVGDNVMLLPTHTVAGALTTGLGFTVTEEVVLTHPVDVCVNVKVTSPAATPVTTPAFVTVANELLLLVHVPPVVGDKVMLLPTHTAAGEDTTGNAFTVTEEVVLEHPVAVSVNVNVTVPAATLVAVLPLTVAFDGSLLIHVPGPGAFNVIVPLIHTDDAEVLTTGLALTVTEAVVFVHPVAVSVKVKVTEPAATPVTTPSFVTVANELLVLAHVPPVVGVKVMLLPTQTAAGALTTGFAFTVTEEVVLLHPVEVWVKVNVALPAATPVTTPAFVTVAMELSLLVHVPPVVGDKVILLPTHTAAGAETTGNALTVTEVVVLEHPVDVSVNVKVTEPAATPVTTPAFVTVAVALLLLTHVPPVVGDKVIVPPMQTVWGALTAGLAFTATEAVVFVQPVAVSVNVKVTVPAPTPVTTPLFITVAMELLLLAHVPPVVGDNVILLPTHTAAGALTTGLAFTVTEEVVLLHPVDVSVKVNVALPAAIPVTTPPFVTVAMALSLLAHVPPVVGDNVILLPTHTAAGALTTGLLTVKVSLF